MIHKRFCSYCLRYINLSVILIPGFMSTINVDLKDVSLMVHDMSVCVYSVMQYVCVGQ